MTTSTDTNLTSIGGQWMIHQPKAVIKQQHHLSNTRETKQNNEVPLKKNFIPIWNYCSSVIYCLVWCSATNQIAQWDRMYWKGAGPLLSFWDSFVNILPVQRICPYDTPLFKYPSDDHSDKIFPRSEITVSVHNCLSYSQSFHKKVDLASNVQLAYSHQLFFFHQFYECTNHVIEERGNKARFSNIKMTSPSTEITAFFRFVCFGWRAVKE